MNSKVTLLKTVVVLVILVLVGVLGVLGLGTVRTYLSGAAAGMEPKGVSVKVDDEAVVISWTTDKEALGYVQYGTTPASLLLSVPSRDELSSGAVKTSHQIALKTFNQNTTYYFRVRSGNNPANYTEWEVFDNGGIPYSFKTKNRAVVPTVAPIAPTTVVPTASPVGQTGCQTGIDYNQDGVVNSLDYRSCLSSGGVPVVTQAMAAPTIMAGDCQPGTDYDKNGVINSLDIVKCRQDTR